MVAAPIPSMLLPPPSTPPPSGGLFPRVVVVNPMPHPASTPLPLTHRKPSSPPLQPLKSHQTGSRNPFGMPKASSPSPLPRVPTLFELTSGVPQPPPQSQDPAQVKPQQTGLPAPWSTRIALVLAVALVLALALAAVVAPLGSLIVLLTFAIILAFAIVVTLLAFAILLISKWMNARQCNPAQSAFGYPTSYTRTGSKARRKSQQAGPRHGAILFC